MKNLILIPFLVSLFFLACEEAPVVFIEPQPSSSETEISFDLMYRGIFLCESDSAVVHIEKNLIFKEKTYAFDLTLEELEDMDEVTLEGDELILENWQEPLPAEVIDGKIHSFITFRDTFFNITRGDVLKTFEGHQILNKRINDKKWEVLVLSLDFDFNLELMEAELPEDIKKLQKITLVKDISTKDKTQYILAPSHMEFEEILKQELLFKSCDVFQRIPSLLKT